MEFGLENRARTLHNAVQRRRHPPLHRVENPPLDLCDGLSGVTLIPAAVEILGDGAELDNKVTDRSSGSTSPRFSCQSRSRAGSSSPMIVRASDPPMKDRR